MTIRLKPRKNVVHSHLHRDCRRLGVAYWLLKQGFTNVKGIDGGIEQWAKGICT